MRILGLLFKNKLIESKSILSLRLWCITICLLMFSLMGNIFTLDGLTSDYSKIESQTTISIDALLKSKNKIKSKTRGFNFNIDTLSFDVSDYVGSKFIEYVFEIKLLDLHPKLFWSDQIAFLIFKYNPQYIYSFFSDSSPPV